MMTIEPVGKGEPTGRVGEHDVQEWVGQERSMIVMGCQIDRQFLQVGFLDAADDVKGLVPDRFGSSCSAGYG